ncbi:Nucleoside-triphosphate phosphatase [Xylaria longipes]|nr:Nucleoside-triphosphate phosphatase [Xylaria longipes]
MRFFYAFAWALVVGMSTSSPTPAGSNGNITVSNTIADGTSNVNTSPPSPTRLDNVLLLPVLYLAALYLPFHISYPVILPITPMMGACMSSNKEDEEQKKRSQAIDRALDDGSKKLHRECKILLLVAKLTWGYPGRLLAGCGTVTATEEELIKHFHAAAPSTVPELGCGGPDTVANSTSLAYTGPDLDDTLIPQLMPPRCIRDQSMRLSKLGLDLGVAIEDPLVDCTAHMNPSEAGPTPEYGDTLLGCPGTGVGDLLVGKQAEKKGEKLKANQTAYWALLTLSGHYVNNLLSVELTNQYNVLDWFFVTDIWSERQPIQRDGSSHMQYMTGNLTEPPLGVLNFMQVLVSDAFAAHHAALLPDNSRLQVIDGSEIVRRPAWPRQSLASRPSALGMPSSSQKNSAAATADEIAKLTACRFVSRNRTAALYRHTTKSRTLSTLDTLVSAITWWEQPGYIGDIYYTWTPDNEKQNDGCYPGLRVRSFKCLQ